MSGETATRLSGSYHMRLGGEAPIAASAPAVARLHKAHKPRQLCKVEHLHGDTKRVCHWAR